MSESMKGEYEVFKILRDMSIMGLNKFGITDGYDVRRFAQANMANGDKLVLLNMIGSERIGRQGFWYKFMADTGKTIRTDEWIDEQRWQFHFIKRMQKNDTVSTVTADDMCNYLLAWFNGPAILELKKQGIANLPIDPHSIIVYNDDSDLYQRRVVFTMNLQVPKSFVWNVPDLSVVDVETYPI